MLKLASLMHKKLAVIKMNDVNKHQTRMSKIARWFSYKSEFALQ